MDGKCFYNHCTETERFTRSEAIDCVKSGVLSIPENKKILDLDFAFFVVRKDLPQVHTLIIPASVTNIVSMRGDYSSGPYGYKNNPFSKIVVSENNQNYSSKDGVLFNKGMDTLLCYPCGRPDPVYHVPETVKTITSESFLNVEHLKQIYFPDNIQIEEYAFISCMQTDFPEITDIYNRQNDYLLVLRSKDFYQSFSGNNTSYYAYNTDVDILDEPVYRVDEDCLNNFLQTGALLVEGHHERVQIMHRFADLVNSVGYDDSDIILKADLTRFVDTFYGDW